MKARLTRSIKHGIATIVVLCFSISFSPASDSAIHAAVKAGDYQAVDALVEKKADINQLDKAGKTPLQYAIDEGDTAMARTLILAGAEIFPEPMMATAYLRRDNPTMNLLLNAGVDPNLDLAGTDQRLFDVAVAENALDTARILIAAKVDIGNHFWEAIAARRDEMALMFLHNYALDPRDKGPNGKTPLEYALAKELHHYVLPILVAHSREPNPEPWLSRAIRNGNSEITMALLKAGYPLGNQRAADRHSLLGWAIAHGMDEVALYLINAGVYVNISERYPATPLFTEKFSESKSFQKLLTTDRGIRPLMMVPVKKNYTIARALVKAGADNSATAKYNYPISIASWFSDVQMMQIIFGRNPEEQTRKLVVDLSRQRVELHENGEVTYSSVCSTGKKGYRTKTGSFVITQKRKRHVSNIYGSSMPNFMRLSCGDFGFHTGVCPGYPASHGCIRLPSKAALHYYKKCTLGDLVVIQE